jgi:short-subunit dehydrogenase
VNAFSEALRQEVTERHVRVALVEPGAVSTELAGHNRPEVLAGLRSSLGDVERMEAGRHRRRHRLRRDPAPAHGHERAAGPAHPAGA